MFKMIGIQDPYNFASNHFAMNYPVPWGVSKGTTGLPTSARDGTKESILYNVSGDEGDGETHTTTYPPTEGTMDVGHVP